MKNKRIWIVTLLLALMLPAVTYAQKKDSKNDDAHYLSGAVPEVNGKVVFSKEYVINGMSKGDIFDHMLSYLNERMAKNGSKLSRVAYANKGEGVIAALGDEWIIFSQSMLSLDRTKINYQITVNCSEGKCKVSISRITYTYRETEHYNAENWITDKIALNKSKTKLTHGLAKWRRKTVDLADTYFTEIKEVLTGQYEKQKEEKEEPIVSADTTAPVVIGTSQTGTPKAKSSAVDTNNTLQSISPDQIPSSVLSAIYHCKVVVVIGNDADNMTTMTAGKGVALGYIDGTPMSFIYFDASQQTSMLNNAKEYTLKFVDPDNKDTIMTMECSAAYSQTENGMKVFAAQILRAEAK